MSAASGDMPDLEVQVRYIPSPECAILEVLFLWEFGPGLQSVLSNNAMGYRLDLRENRLIQTRRWLFEYWPKRYDEFRTVPINEALRELDRHGAVLVLSADLASFYDTVDPSFLLSSDFVAQLESASPDTDLVEYRRATMSLLRFYARFRDLARRRTGLAWPIGIPIGALTSRVVANLALATLDRAIEEKPETRCYRRYVDDFVIVAGTDRSEPGDVDVLVRKYIPHVSVDTGVFRLNADLLMRKGSEFTIQKEKCKVYHLVGRPGRDFLLAIRNDFQRLVSEGRAFLDPSVLSDGDLENLVRAGVPGRPLTVLRDVDRSRLEHYALSTRLRSLERVSVLVDRKHAEKLVRSALNEVLRFLVGDGNWVENFEAAMRILRLSVRAGDWRDTERLIGHMDAVWRDIERLRRSTKRLVHRGREINSDSAWVWLRNYLHARRTEAICSVIRPPKSAKEFPEWFRSTGIMDRTRMLRWQSFVRRARFLAAADLRAFDREDDDFGPNAYDSSPNDQHFGWDDADLKQRLSLVGQLVDISTKLGDEPWKISAASLFLCTRPPSYFDIARRWLYRSEEAGFQHDIFGRLLEIVNAIRGTRYSDPVGETIDAHTVRIPREEAVERGSSREPRLILGNLVAPSGSFEAAAGRVSGSRSGRPVLTVGRLRGVAHVLAGSLRVAQREPGRGNLLVLPELSLPRAWFRQVANYVARTGSFGVIVGLEYLHHPIQPWVFNQAWIVVPGPWQSAATWPWTKGHPAKVEAEELNALGVRLSPYQERTGHRRTVVDSPYGRISVLICSELIETRRVADLLGRVELVAVPSWNRDTSSYDHLVQTVGVQLHSIIAVANNGDYSDCRAWAPKRKRWERDLCRLIERGENDVVFAEIPLSSLRSFREGGDAGSKGDNREWRPLPPYWPR